MGGMREEILSPPVKGKSSYGKLDVQLNAVRIHDHQGEVHFHADHTKIKCAVDTTEFYSIWRKEKHKLMQQPIYFIGHDGRGGHSVAIISLSGSELSVTVNKCSLGDSFVKLDKFASGQ